MVAFGNATVSLTASRSAPIAGETVSRAWRASAFHAQLNAIGSAFAAL